MRVAVDKGINMLVLGAWGYGAYRNPLGEVVEAWREVLSGDKEKWEGIEEVVFAILDRNGTMHQRFKDSWGDGIQDMEE